MFCFVPLLLIIVQVYYIITYILHLWWPAGDVEVEQLLCKTLHADIGRELKILTNRLLVSKWFVKDWESVSQPKQC